MAWRAGMFTDSTTGHPFILSLLVLLLDVATGVEHLHARNVVHGEQGAACGRGCGAEEVKRKWQRGLLLAVQRDGGHAEGEEQVWGGCAVNGIGHGGVSVEEGDLGLRCCVVSPSLRSPSAPLLLAPSRLPSH